MTMYERILINQRNNFFLYLTITAGTTISGLREEIAIFKDTVKKRYSQGMTQLLVVTKGTDEEVKITIDEFMNNDNWSTSKYDGKKLFLNTKRILANRNKKGNLK